MNDSILDPFIGLVAICLGAAALWLAAFAIESFIILPAVRWLKRKERKQC